MINLIEDNKEFNYRVYNSEFIANKIKSIRYEGKILHANYKRIFQDSDNGSTWDYNKYNIFSLAVGNPLFYEIYKDLVFVIKDYLKDQPENSDFIWFESWLNYHSQKEVLDWHNHAFSFHGYISVDPKDSTTEFKDYAIKNKPGNIYIGPGNREHRVVVNTPYDDTRITLGFDVVSKSLPGVSYIDNLSFIPVI